MASFDIGAKLRQERVGQGLAIEDVFHTTRIPLRFLEAIEAGDFEQLPGLLFARNFVRQYAQAVRIDPDPLLAELPKPDISSSPLPDPPPRVQTIRPRAQQTHSLGSSAAWFLVAAGAAYVAYVHFNHTPPLPPSDARTVAAIAPVAADPAESELVAPPAVTEGAPSNRSPQPDARVRQSPAAAQTQSSPPVELSMTARQPAWVQVSADGKMIYTGTLRSNETKQVSAAQHVDIVTGNAGGLMLALNGKNLDSLGTSGQVRSVKVTAEGLQFRATTPSPFLFDPL